MQFTEEDGGVVQAIADLAEAATDAKVVNIDGKEYATKPVHDPRKPDPQPEAIVVHTLGALVDYVKSQLDEDDVGPDKVVVHVVNPTKVRVLGPLYGDFRKRDTFAVAECFPLTGAQRIGQYQTLEDFNLWLRTAFEESEDRKAILEITGNVVDESGVTQRDDGITQQVTARVGVARLGTVNTKASYTLAPYRTFSEVSQPDSEFVLRIKSGGAGERPTSAGLFDASGNEWMEEAISHIAALLKANLPEGVPVLA